MSSPVVTAGEDWPVSRAALEMSRNGFTALPVIDGGGRFVGIVTEADLLVDQLHRRYSHRESTVGRVMTREAVSVAPDADAEVLARRLVAGGRRVVPVVAHGQVVGIVSRRDLLNHAAVFRERPRSGFAT